MSKFIKGTGFYHKKDNGRITISINLALWRAIPQVSIDDEIIIIVDDRVKVLTSCFMVMRTSPSSMKYIQSALSPWRTKKITLSNLLMPLK